jgi:hypothetical protein
MKQILKAALALASIAVATPSAAGEVSLGVGAGTWGGHAEVGYKMWDFIGVRVGGNYLPVDYDTEVSGKTYAADVRMKMVGATVDVYPFLGGLRLSAGMRWNGSEGDFSVNSNQPVDIGGTVYTDTRLDAHVEYKDTYAPYLGVGYVFGITPFAALAFDVGAVHTGKADVTLTVSGAGAGAVPEADRAREEQKLEDKLNDFQFYPVAALTLMVRF